MTRAHLFFVLVLVPPASALAQLRELEAVTVSMPAAIRTSDFVLVGRLDVPRATPSDVPPGAVDALTRYHQASEAIAAAIAAERAASGAARELEHQRVVAADARLVDARRALTIALERSESTLTRPALLVLGMLRYEAASLTQLDALDAHEACVTGGRTDCVEPPPIDDASATAVWARVTGHDLLAAYASYERGYSAREHWETASARDTFAATLATEGLPPRLEADAAFLLGEMGAEEGRADAADAFERCAAVAGVEIAAHCALRAGHALLLRGEPARAIALLAPILEALHVADDARLLASEAMTRRAPTSLPESLPTAVRIRLWSLGADRLRGYGFVTAALDALERARAIGPDPIVDALATRIAAARATDTPEAWLRRVATFCAAAHPELDGGHMTIRARFEPRAVHASAVSPRALLPVARCIEQAPGPESPLPGSFRVVLTLRP